LKSVRGTHLLALWDMLRLECALVSPNQEAQFIALIVRIVLFLLKAVTRYQGLWNILAVVGLVIAVPPTASLHVGHNAIAIIQAVRTMTSIDRLAAAILNVLSCSRMVLRIPVAAAVAVEPAVPAHSPTDLRIWK